ncbi:MAG: response regulator transcription factor [Elusimicrobia bacterium]|nr:response regulator transcription factor [Elusimicrobiota bacterium]
MKTVLVVEDEPDFAKIVKRILEPEGFAVHWSESAELGWQALQSQGCDLAILDWNLPGMSGIDLCRRIREDTRFKGLAVALLTVRNTSEEQIQGLKDSGADLYLTKPIKPDEFLARIQSLVGLFER